jgi:hypothetical protein
VHTAPPVSLRCQAGPVWGLVCAGVPALATAVLSAWVLMQLEQNPLPAVLLAPVVGSLLWSRSRHGAVQLSWDGQRWAVDGQTVRLDLMMDLGGVLLLRLRPHERPVGGPPTRWLPVTAQDAGAAWHALRVAVHGPASRQALHG